MMTWLNRSVATLIATLQLLDIYRFVHTIFYYPIQYLLGKSNLVKNTGTKDKDQILVLSIYIFIVNKNQHFRLDSSYLGQVCFRFF